jgi:hypothetical protein
MLGWYSLKKYIFNKAFDGGKVVAEKTENLLDDELVEINRRELLPILQFPHNSATYIRSAITESLRASVFYAKKHKKCEWLWKWLEEVRVILNSLELEEKKRKK